MSEEERPVVAALDPGRIIKTLDRNDVKFVLIGALAARLYGFPRLTADAAITPAADSQNLDNLVAALRELDARIYTENIPEGLAFDCSPATLKRAEMWNLVTDAGRLDVAFKPSGTDGFNDLAENAETFHAYGVQFLVTSLADIIRSKEAAGRPRDREDVVMLRAIQKKTST